VIDMQATQRIELGTVSAEDASKPVAAQYLVVKTKPNATNVLFRPWARLR